MPSAPRVVALVGPYLSGKTTLLEALLFASGTTSRRGSVRDGNSVGDHAPEARARSMSTEINVANANFLGDPWTILDCPGSVELLYEAQQAMLVADTVVVVCEPEVERAVTVSALLHFLGAARHPAHAVHQQARRGERAGARRAGGIAIGLRAAAGAAPGAAARRRERNHRLCRSGQRARLSLPAGPGLRPDPAARRVLGPGRRHPHQPCRKARRFRRRSCSNSCSRTCSPRRRTSTST